MIVVDSPDPRIFEQAIFILPTDGGGVSSRQLVDEAVRIARSYARPDRRPPPVASACVAVGGMGRVCLRPGVAAGCAALIVAAPWPADAVSAYFQRFPLFRPFIAAAVSSHRRKYPVFLLTWGGRAASALLYPAVSYALRSKRDARGRLFL